MFNIYWACREANVSFLKYSINVWFIYCIWVTGIFFTMLLSSKYRGSFKKKPQWCPSIENRLSTRIFPVGWLRYHRELYDELLNASKWKQMLNTTYLCFSYKIACILIFCFPDIKMWHIFVSDKIKVDSDLNPNTFISTNKHIILRRLMNYLVSYLRLSTLSLAFKNIH